MRARVRVWMMVARNLLWQRSVMRFAAVGIAQPVERKALKLLVVG